MSDAGTAPGAADAAGRAPVDIRVVRGEPDAEELAAVLAVLTASLDALAAESRREEPEQSGWDRSRRAPNRGVRTASWRSFGG